MMVLCIDAGNTQTKLAVFDQEGVILFIEKVVDLEIRYLSALMAKYPIRAAILSAVNTRNADCEEYLRGALDYFVVLDHKTPLPIENRYRTPETLGKDRLAGVVGASALFPGENCLVVDAGTCIKYDFIDAEKVYHGGSILPGIHMRLEALEHFTARLPLVTLRGIDQYIGDTTETAILTGLFCGIRFEANGYIAMYRYRSGSLRVIFTGGDAEWLQKLLEDDGKENFAPTMTESLKIPIFAAPELVLIGLRTILSYTLALKE